MTGAEAAKSTGEVAKRGFPVFGLLGAVLVVLKALGCIQLPWFWVLGPFWMPLAIVLGIVVIDAIGTAQRRAAARRREPRVAFV